MSLKADRNQERVRKLSLLPENKECMDCLTRSTPYVVMDYCTFVCSFCSGIHRSFQHRVKGISMTNFKDEEVEKLASGGNAVATKKWRATWNEKQYPKPKSSQEVQVKKFIRLTYEKKQWYSDDPNARPADEDDLPEVRPINEIIDEPIEIKIDRTSAPITTKTTRTTKQTNAFDDDDDWDADFDNSATPQKPQNDLTSFFGDDSAPDSTLHNQQQYSTGAQQQSTTTKANIDLDSLFGPSAGSSTYPPQQQAPFGAGPYGAYPPQSQYSAYDPYQQQQQYGAPYGYPQQQAPYGGGYAQQAPYDPYQQQQFGAPYGGGYAQQPYGQYPPQQNGGAFGAPQQQQPQGNPFGGAPRGQVSSNPFGGGDSNPFDVSGSRPTGGIANRPAQQKQQEPSKPDPFQSLTSLSKSSLGGKSSAPTSASNNSANAFDDFPF